MGEAKRRKALDPNYGKERTVKPIPDNFDYRLPPGFINTAGRHRGMDVPLSVFRIAISLYPKVGRGYVLISPNGKLAYEPLDSKKPLKVRQLLETYDPQTQVVAAWPSASNPTRHELLIHTITPDARALLQTAD